MFATARHTIAERWRKMTTPAIPVRLNDGEDSTVCLIAGQRSMISRISISIPCCRCKKRDLPRPLFYDVQKNGTVLSMEERETMISSEEINISNRRVTIALFARVTSVRTYSVRPTFVDRIKFKGKRQSVEFTVKPSQPESLTVIGIKPAHGDGTGNSVYRSGSAKISVEAKDKYGNIYLENDLPMDIVNVLPENSFIRMISSTCDVKNRCHVVTLQCDKTGIVSFDLGLPRARQAAHVQGLEIIPPPVSARKSRIVQIDPVLKQRTDNNQVDAGQVMEVRMDLYDIY